jgi:hypothetical protein
MRLGVVVRSVNKVHANEQFGDLHGIRCGALPNVIAHYPKRQAVINTGISSGAPDENLVAS